MRASSPRRLRPRTAAALLLAALAAPAVARAEGGSPAAPAERVWDVLLDEDVTRTEDRVLVGRLVAVGSGGVPTLFGIVAGSDPRLDAEPGTLADPRPLRRPVDDLALAALGALPPRDVLDHLDAVAGGGLDLETRLAVVRVLGVVPAAEAASSILELAAGLADHELKSVGSQGVVRRALVNALAQGAGAYAQLSRSLDELDPRLLSLVVRALGEAGRGEGVDVLGRLLGRVPELDLLVLDQISRTGARVIWQVGDEPAALLQAYLDDDDPRLRGQAALGLGELQDVKAFPRLVALLSDPDPAVRRCALFALQAMSDKDLPGEAEEWTRWFASQRAWLEGEGAELRAELTSPDPHRVMAALQGLCQRRFFRHELADELAVALQAEAPEVTLAACTALTQLGSKRAVPHLIEVLRSWDEELSGAAWKALVALTGADLPWDEGVWERSAERGFALAAR